MRADRFVRREDIGGGRSRPVIRCECGSEIVCYNFTNTCECGIDYNMSGQELAPREQWGEETGESVADILAADIDAAEMEVELQRDREADQAEWIELTLRP